MNDRQRSLLQRLDEFSFDQPGARRTFLMRLAQENRWSIEFARRVLREYRRFAFLAVEAGHPVSPSEVVDDAWHQHLIDTQSYWNDFCPNVLKQPLHHLPSTGTEAEQTTLHDWYSRTLASYERFFGQKPPADLWPAPEEKRRSRTRPVHVDASRHWIIPHPRRAQWNLVSAAALLGLLVTLGCAADPAGGPLDLPGPQFLSLYLTCLGIVLGMSIVWRLAIKGPSGLPAQMPDLSEDEAAYLAGGRDRMANVVLARLNERGHIGVHPTVGRIVAGTPLPGDAPEMDRIALLAIGEETTLKAFHRAMKPASGPVIARLQELELIPTSGTSLLARLVPGTLFLLLLVFGLAKVMVGINRNRPVELLVLLCVVTLVMALKFVLAGPRRTWRGSRVLKLLMDNYRAGRHAAEGQEFGMNAAPSGLAMGLALLGPSVLAGTALGDFQRMILPPPSSGNSSSSGCGTGCSGGGGGCGGGGCGGCGGGGD